MHPMHENRNVFWRGIQWTVECGLRNVDCGLWTTHTLCARVCVCPIILPVFNTVLYRTSKEWEVFFQALLVHSRCVMRVTSHLPQFAFDCLPTANIASITIMKRQYSDGTRHWSSQIECCRHQLRWHKQNIDQFLSSDSWTEPSFWTSLLLEHSRKGLYNQQRERSV